MFVIVAKIVEREVVFGQFRNITMIGDRIMVNDKIRSVGTMINVMGNFRYIIKNTMFSEITIEPYNPNIHSAAIEI